MNDDHLHPFGQDDENWLNLLAGHAVPNANSHTRQEAEALRQAILSQPISPIHELSAAELTQGRERLLFALQRATSNQSWWKRPALLSGLAALVGIALLPMIISHHESSGNAPNDEPVQPRIKNLRMPSVVRVEQPAVTARALATELGAAGIAVQPTLQGKSWFIDVPVPKPLPPQITTVLARYGIKPPPDVRLLVELAPRASQ